MDLKKGTVSRKAPVLQTQIRDQTTRVTSDIRYHWATSWIFLISSSSCGVLVNTLIFPECNNLKSLRYLFSWPLCFWRLGWMDRWGFHVHTCGRTSLKCRSTQRSEWMHQTINQVQYLVGSTQVIQLLPFNPFDHCCSLLTWEKKLKEGVSAEDVNFL